MLMWLYEAFSPPVLARHVALFLLVATVAMPTLLSLRLAALVAGIALILASTVFAYDPVGLFWAILFIAVNLVQLALGRNRTVAPLTPEERLFHEKVVPSLTPAQSRRLLEAGEWRDVAAGAALTREGEVVTELCFVSRGTVDIIVGGSKIAEVGPGSLIGEVGLSTGDAATATAICATPVRYLGFRATELYRLLDRDVDLQDAVELAIQRSLRDKLHRANQARSAVAR